MRKDAKWFENAVIYEIFPDAFSDMGIKGITNKLNYIKNLGADAIWLCPVFESDFLDGGYDIKDYYTINQRFGTMADFEELVNKANQSHIKIIMDIALNHTSNTHSWFEDARRSRDSQYRDYYIFRNGKNASYPNNWISSKTMKPTWTYNKYTDDYYLHIYTKYQPDLNWESRCFRQEAARILNFWTQKGVSGFRLDVINKIAKPDDLEHVESKRQFADYLYENNPKSYEYIKAIRQNIMKNDTLLIGQLSSVDRNQAIEYVDMGKGLDLFLQFDHIDIDKDQSGMAKKWKVADFWDSVFKWQNTYQLGAMPTVFLGSHDSPRMVSHYTDAKGQHTDTAAKMLCVLQMFLHGTQIIYMGDELALTNVKNTSIHQFNDIRTHDIYHAKKAQDISEDQLINALNYITRDNARYKIPWDTADKMQGKADSVLNFYKKIIEFRKSSDVILHGSTVSLQTEKEVFAYQRHYNNVIITVLCNMKGNTVKTDCAQYGVTIDISNYDKVYDNQLLPYEVKVFKKRTACR